MPIKLEFEQGNLTVFGVSGQLGLAEFEQAQRECEATIQKVGNIKMLVLLQNFLGWERTGDWEDMSFIERNDPFIDKLAIVGADEWRDLVYAYTGKGFRPVSIEYFEVGHESAARNWLDNS